jgi:hypothetical protein
MPDPAAPFALAPEIAAHALVLAEAAARTSLDLRDDPPAGNVTLALFLAPISADSAEPDAEDSAAVIAFMDEQLIAEHGSAATSAVVGPAGFSPTQICRLKAFECVRTGVEPYAALIERRKFDGATRSFGSHRFEQIAAAGDRVELIAAASGWRGDQDYLAAMIVPATLHFVLLQFGVLPRDLVVSETFVLSAGDWEYPAG